ncbi:MAG: hypothetical protein ABR976_05490 [Terracidiphilus sp.]|jgi:hypothetical protein
MVADQQLPDAPQPQLAMAAGQSTIQDQSTQQPSSTPATQTTQAQGSSSSQTGQQTGSEKSQREKAEEQLKEQEKQRTLGIVPAFNISYRQDAVSMTAGQKMKLAFRSSTDPVTFGGAALVAGYHEASDDDTEFGWGIEGYGKRTGAAYLDAFDGTMIGNGILPALLRQDPRYFRLGHGSKTHRLLYALVTNVICKHDNTHKWEPNYSNVGGNIIAGAISNLYYPSQNSGITQTFSNGMIVTAEGGIGSVFQEFWPDISRKFLHRDPTHGLDAQARALDAQEKQAAKEAKEKPKQSQEQK